MLGLLFVPASRPENLGVHLHDGRDLDFALAAQGHFPAP